MYIALEMIGLIIDSSRHCNRTSATINHHHIRASYDETRVDQVRAFRIASTNNLAFAVIAAQS